MTASRKINFNTGIRKIEHAVHPSMSLTRNALKLLADIIKHLNETFVGRCLAKFKPNRKNNVMKLSVASKAVHEVCSGNIKSLAVAEGNKCLLKYNCALLQYNPRDKITLNIKAKENQKIKARKQERGTEYSRGVSNLSKLVFPEATLHTKGKEAICKILAKLSNKICGTVKNSCQNQETMTAQDVRTAMESILPEEMRKHALAEGAKMIFFYESGRILFEPPKRRTMRIKTDMKDTTQKGFLKSGKK